jgi:hypothetical protein
MKIGFSTIFSYRPHVQQVYYLSKQLKDAGHEVFYLNCKSSLPTCYTLELRPNNRLKECSKCRVGSLYSYTKENNTFISPDLFSKMTRESLDNLTKSSSYTLTRIEDPKDINSAEVIKLQKKLHPTIQIVYANTMKWIKENKLEYVFFFNGRMDATNALKQACHDSGIQYCSVERPLFANGLQLNFNENCLSLRTLNELHVNFIDKPLTYKQAHEAASLVTSRFRKTENLEWRSFNKDSIDADWPTNGSGKKVLIMPSSRNEVWSEHEWRNDWLEFPQIFEKIIEKLNDTYGGDFSNCVFRSHPIWAQKVGGMDGSKIVDYYKAWCEEKGIHFIAPESKVSSSNLMKQTDFLIINGSTAAYESCILGIPTINTARTRYLEANIVTNILCEEDLNSFDPSMLLNRDKKDLLKYTLRFLYSYFVRYAIFNSEIIANGAHDFSFAPKIDTNRLEEMMKTGYLIPDDETFANNESGENQIIELIQQKDWNRLEYTNKVKTSDFKKVNRRGLYVFVDSIRNKFQRGDL